MAPIVVERWEHKRTKRGPWSSGASIGFMLDANRDMPGPYAEWNNWPPSHWIYGSHVGLNYFSENDLRLLRVHHFVKRQYMIPPGNHWLYGASQVVYEPEKAQRVIKIRRDNV